MRTRLITWWRQASANLMFELANLEPLGQLGAR
jgi:hypothetical protein